MKKHKLRMLFGWLWHGLTGSFGYILHCNVDTIFRPGATFGTLFSNVGSDKRWEEVSCATGFNLVKGDC